MKTQAHRFHSEGSEVRRSSFPHRNLRKDIPIIAEKMIPVHKFQVHRSYKGNSSFLSTFDHWAYVPMKLTKKSLQKMYVDLQIKSKQNPYKDQDKNIDRSQQALRQYLKRKQKIYRKQSIYYSQIINFKELQRVEQRIEPQHYQLTQISEEYHSKKETLNKRFKRSWEERKQKMYDHMDSQYRRTLHDRGKTEGSQSLFQKLSTKYDPHSANTPKRFSFKLNPKTGDHKPHVFFSQLEGPSKILQ